MVTIEDIERSEHAQAETIECQERAWVAEQSNLRHPESTDHQYNPEDTF